MKVNALKTLQSNAQKAEKQREKHMGIYDVVYHPSVESNRPVQYLVSCGYLFKGWYLLSVPFGLAFLIEAAESINVYSVDYAVDAFHLSGFIHQLANAVGRNFS